VLDYIFYIYIVYTYVAIYQHNTSKLCSKIPHHATNQMSCNKSQRFRTSNNLSNVCNWIPSWAMFYTFQTFKILFSEGGLRISPIFKKFVTFLGICEACLIKYCKSNIIPVRTWKQYVGNVRVVPPILNFDTR